MSFDLERGDCLAVVGESGAGKTTLSRCLLRLIEPSGGRVLFHGADVLSMPREELRRFRRRAQIVFQDPYGSLNPRLRAGPMIEEILKVHGLVGSNQRTEERVKDLFGLVGLHPSHATRFPHEFSGGQRQRLGIARALSVEPELLILDEPVSSLDLSVQAQILNLLVELRERLDLTMILVAHDLAVVRQLANRVAVMLEGRIVEISPVKALFEHPAHPYTRGLLEALSSALDSVHGEGPWAPLQEEIPSSSSLPQGCSYYLRCPHPGKGRECREGQPELRALARNRTVACWKEIPGPLGG